jgi:pathogenesis-related protein 1
MGRTRSVLATASLALATACATPSQPAPSPDQRQPTTAPPPPGDPLGDPLAEAFVAAHNRHRSAASPTANPALPPVRWDEHLAARARAWAQRCEFRHSKTDYGENLGARTDQADPATIVAAWADEAAHYDHRRDRCASGQVCGHYTQVVWRSSTQIGCAVARCSGGGPFGGGEWFLSVCNYSPPGNWKGEKPY